jgi:FkbM family methyltransferase
MNETGNGFWTQLITDLLNSSYSHQVGNIDTGRFRSVASPSRNLKNWCLKKAEAYGFYRRSDLNLEPLKTEGLDRTYQFLQDQVSKNLLVKLIAYRVLGDQRVRLPLNNPEYWNLRNSLGQFVEKRSAITGIPILGSLDLFRLNGIRLYCTQLGLLNQFFLQQYRCDRAHVGVQSGDIVIDGGACAGDTALCFAQHAKHVVSFECMPSNLEILRRNLELNPNLSSKIEVVPKALWSRSGERFLFEDRGPGSRATSTGDGVQVVSQSIDDFVSSNGLPKVDFIKMDIEGAEPEALIGAEHTIRTYRPQLAICVYHDLTHFVSIPEWLASLKLGYRFYLDHFSIYGEETVLFATSVTAAG